MNPRMNNIYNKCYFNYVCNVIYVTYVINVNNVIYISNVSYVSNVTSITLITSITDVICGGNMGKKVLVELPEDVHSEIKLRAVKSGKTIRELVKEAVEEYVKGKATVEATDNVINLNEFCKDLTMKECLEKIKREVKDYRSKMYSISFEV